MINIKKMERITTSNCQDLPDSRNYQFSEYIKEFAEWWEKQRPYVDIKLFDQWFTSYCTRYALAHINSAQNFIEYKENWQIYEQKDPLDLWNKGNKRKFLIMALDDFKKFGLIEWHLEIKKDWKEIENIRKALNMGCYIYTWSNNGLWGIYRKPYNYMKRKDWKIVWHAWAIVDDQPDNKRFVVANSFGTDWGDKWYFYLPYEDISSTFTLWAIVDKDETGKFQMFKLKEKIKQFVDLGKNIFEWADTETRQKFITRAISDYFKKRWLYE
jgi:hypothetical protein